jgi:hypothetical protein
LATKPSLCVCVGGGGLMWMGHPASGPSYRQRVLAWRVECWVQEGSSLLGCQALPWRSRCPYGLALHDCQAGVPGFWTNAAWANHPMWDGVEFRSSLSEGVCKLLRWFILLWWRRFESSGGHRVVLACKKGEAFCSTLIFEKSKNIGNYLFK